jgi:mannan endo-1,4-beta-mannosidase
LKAHRKYRLICTLLSIALLLTAIPTGMGIEPSTVEAAGIGIPVNPNASPGAVKLLKYLSDISGKGIVTGQHDYLESPDEFSNKLQATSGKFAALHGYELGAISGQTESTVAWQRQNVVTSAINWHKNGGIVAMTFHANLPGTTYDWSNVSKSLSQTDFNKYVTPGTAQYNSLIAELDKVAVSLKSLRDAGVPVLWRPYHEMNGGWFWWGQKTNFSALWNIMYDRFVNVHQLNNLLWVWSPNAPNAWADAYSLTYPGADKVDILAADIYENDFKQSHHDSLLALAAGKPIAIGENGEMPDPQSILKTQTKWSFMMNWGKMLYEKNTTDTIKNFMNNSFTITRDEYMTGVIPTASPVPTATATPAPASPDGLRLPVKNGLQGQYFRNMTLTGTPALIRDDASVDFNWRLTAPDSSLGINYFSVRWTGKIKPLYTETYNIYSASDDGIRVWVDGKLIIDSWVKQSGTERVGSIPLEAGRLYDIKIEYYENDGDARIRLMWESPRQIKGTVPASSLFIGAAAVPVTAATPVPTAAPIVASTPAPTAAPTPTPAPTATPLLTYQIIAPPAVVPANGLKGEYFKNMQLTGTPAVVRTDSALDFNWRLLSPDAEIGVDYFSVRWSGKIKPLYSETYQIYTNSDDGIRVWIDGKSVIDSWIKQSGTERQGSITLNAGQLYDIRVEYYENQGDARVRLMWESPSQLKGTVPSSALFLPDAI